MVLTISNKGWVVPRRIKKKIQPYAGHTGCDSGLW